MVFPVLFNANAIVILKNRSDIFIALLTIVTQYRPIRTCRQEEGGRMVDLKLADLTMADQILTCSYLYS